MAVAFRVVIVMIPSMLRIAEALFVRPPAPERVFPTVSVPEFVYVPVIETKGIKVAVVPLIVIEVPVKVCWLPAKMVKVVALFVKLLANV